MEDILASIRRILADGEEGAPAAEAGAADTGHVSNAAEPTAIDDVFVLDQTMLIEEPAPMPPDAEQPHVPTHEPPPDFSHLDAGAPLLDPGAAAAAGAHLGALARAVGTRNVPVYRNWPTLEDMLREEMRPLMKAWLDENLAPLVERLVRAEIERLQKR